MSTCKTCGDEAHVDKGDNCRRCAAAWSAVERTTEELADAAHQWLQGRRSALADMEAWDSQREAAIDELEQLQAAGHAVEEARVAREREEAGAAA